MAKTDSVALFTEGARMLAEADTIQKTKELKSLALTAADWARRKGIGDEAVQYARAYALDAERKMGQMLQETERAKGAAAGGKKEGSRGHYVAPRDNTPTLAELNVTKRESSEAQKLAALPDEEYEDVRLGKQSRTQAKRRVRAKEIQREVSLPDAKYRVIYADPPWSYGNTQPDYHPEQRDHYPVMKLADICALPVAEWCEDNAVLFLWVTSPILEESFQVIRAWGFRYKTSFIWDKVKHNMGHYNSVRHELLLVCTRGSCQPDVPKLFDSVQTVERTTHSTKPEVFREIIDTIYPHGKRLEMFARSAHEGWDVYGHEAPVS